MLLCNIHYSVNKLASIDRLNATEAVITYKPSVEQQKQMSLNGVQGQFIVQYDVDRSSMEEKGGELHVIARKLFF